MRFAVQSLLAHGLLVGGMAWFLAHDGGHVEGSSGLAGPARTRFDVTMEAVKTVKTETKAPAPAPPPVQEGLPVRVKNEKAVEIDSPPPPPETHEPVERSDGESASAPAGRAGQGGPGSTAAVKIGDSDRTNRFGLYLRKISRKIQSNLGRAGMLEFPTKAKLILELRRDGSVAKITVAESSGDADLDRLAIRAVQKSIPFDPWDADVRVELPVIFSSGGDR